MGFGLCSGHFEARPISFGLWRITVGPVLANVFLRRPWGCGAVFDSYLISPSIFAVKGKFLLSLSKMALVPELFKQGEKS